MALTRVIECTVLGPKTGLELTQAGKMLAVIPMFRPTADLTQSECERIRSVQTAMYLCRDHLRRTGRLIGGFDE
jgi:hypothetical protein